MLCLIITFFAGISALFFAKVPFAFGCCSYLTPYPSPNGITRNYPLLCLERGQEGEVKDGVR
jgi:hypothetical protein